MRRPIAIACAAAALSLSVAPRHAGAQAALQLEPGAKVRLELRATQGRREGRLVALDGDSVRVRESLGTSAFALGDVRTLEAVSGRERHVLRGMGWGFAIGAAAGAIVGVASFSPCESTEFLGCYLEPESRSQAAIVGGAFAGVLGLAVGALVGAVPRDRWVRVPLDQGLRVGLTALPRGTLGLAVHASF